MSYPGQARYNERRERRLERHGELKLVDWGWHNKAWMQENALHRRRYMKQWRVLNAPTFVSYDRACWSRDIADEKSPLELLMEKEEALLAA